MRWLVVLLFLVAGCSNQPAAVHRTPSSTISTESSPTPSESPGESMAAPPSETPAPSTPAPPPSPAASPAAPSAPSYAALVDLFARGGGYDIALVSASGEVVARAQPTQRSSILDAIELPY